MCDDSDCHSACVEGDDCEDGCLGICAEPGRQSVPTDPAGGSPAPPSGDDRDRPEPVEDPDPCACPAGDICVELCPVCPPEIPEEDCQCELVCVSF